MTYQGPGARLVANGATTVFTQPSREEVAIVSRRFGFSKHVNHSSLKRLREGSAVLSPEVLISADLAAVFHHRPARFFPLFHYPLQLGSQPRI
jgi:hypothetical protein